DLAEHVAHARDLEHRAHRAARDHAGTRGGRPKHDLTRAEVAPDEVRNRGAVERDAEDTLPRTLGALTDGIGNFLGFAEAHANLPVAVAHDDEGAEAEAPTTLDDLGHAVDVDHPLLELVALFLDLSGFHRA